MDFRVCPIGENSRVTWPVTQLFFSPDSNMPEVSGVMTAVCLYVLFRFCLKSVCPAYQQCVKYRHGSHGLNNGYCTGQDTGIVPATYGHCDGMPLFVYSLLFHKQSRDRLEGHTEVNVFSVADTALYAAAVIALESEVWNLRSEV